MTPTYPVLVAGAWMGIVCGFVEGIGLLAFQEFGWTTWDFAQFGVAAEIIPISTVFVLLLFCVIALFFEVLRKMFPRWTVLRGAIYVLSFLTFVDWLMVSGRLRNTGVAILALGLAAVFLRWFAPRQDAVLAFWRRSLVWVAAIALAVALLIVGGRWWMERSEIANLPPANTGAPNIIVIVVDTLRADHVSAYGYTRPTTPNIDHLADRGVLFEGAFATASWTLPSHVSMLTGLYPHQHGAEETYYRGHEKTLPEALREHGYRTGAVSANTLWFARHRGVGRGFIRFDDYFHSIADMASRTMLGRRFAKGILPRLGYEDHPGRRRAPSVNQGALGWIDKEPGKPFFLFLNYLDSHDPYLPPAPYRTKFSHLPDPGGQLNGRQGRYYPELTPEQLQGEVDAYDGAINYIDEHIGQLVAALEQRHLIENTILIVTSDHGESFGEHGLLMHLNGLYRETLHVPLIVVWPGHLTEKQRRSMPVSLAALPTTVLELAGLPNQGSFPVPSLAGILKDAAAPLADHCPLAELAQFPHDAIKRNPCYSGRLKSLVCGSWHYVAHEKLGEELYRWTEDPQELNNLTKTPGGRQVADEFGVRLRGMLGREPFPPGPVAGGGSP